MQNNTVDPNARSYCGYCFRTIDPNDPNPEFRLFVQCNNCKHIVHHTCFTKYPKCCDCNSVHFQNVEITSSVDPIFLQDRIPIDIQDEASYRSQIHSPIISVYLFGGGVIGVVALLALIALNNVNNSVSSTSQSSVLLTETPHLNSTSTIPILDLQSNTATYVTFDQQSTEMTTASVKDTPTFTLVTQTSRPSDTPDVHPTPIMQSITSLDGSVTSNRLNIRSGPGPEYKDMGTLSRGDTVSLVGRNTGATWGQLDNSGWINLRFVSLRGNINLLPVTISELGGWGIAGAYTGVRGRASDVLRIRGGPGADYMQLSNPDTIKSGTTMDIVGRSTDGNWYQINVDGRSGWVNAKYTTITLGNIHDLPVTR